MDALPASVWIFVAMALVLAAVTVGLSTFLFCGAAKINLVQDGEREQLYDPVTGETKPVSTSIFDDAESLCDCDTVVSKTVLRKEQSCFTE